MKSALLIKIALILLLMVFLVAPFTFLKPTIVDKTSTDPVSKIVGKKKPKVKVKKVQEKPLHDVILPDFAAIKDVKSKKKQFFDFIRPAVVKQNNTLLATRVKLNKWLEQVSLELSLTEQENKELIALVKRYRINKNASLLSQLNELLVRVDIVPTSLVLVQAANESAWGTSRFSRIGLNFFGIWCYQPGCGMVPGSRNTGAKHEVEAFKSLDIAVARYFHNLNSNNAYRVFRTIRLELRSNDQPLNPEILATGLLPYSERGADYVIDITEMLRHNKQYFTKDGVAQNNVTDRSAL
jgi:Bax protein